MTTVKIDLPDDQAAALRATAMAQGLSLEDWFKSMVTREDAGKKDMFPGHALLDWSQCPAVESIPGKVSGAWVFKDTRMPVAIVFQNIEADASIEEIMEWFDVSREEIVAVLKFAARSLEAPVPAHA